MLSPSPLPPTVLPDKDRLDINRTMLILKPKNPQASMEDRLLLIKEMSSLKQHKKCSRPPHPLPTVLPDKDRGDINRTMFILKLH